MDGSRHFVSVAAAVVDSGGRILAVQRRDNHAWQPPGGVLELHETIAGGLKREVLEETGVRVEPVALSGVYKNMKRGIVSLVFRCRPVEGIPGPSDEASEVSWLTPDEVRRAMAEAFAVRVLDALTNDGPATRVHDGLQVLDG